MRGRREAAAIWRASSPTFTSSVFAITATANSFGARWFDENWKPQFDQPEWKNTLAYYIDLMKDLLDKSLAEGAMGFSTTISPSLVFNTATSF